LPGLEKATFGHPSHQSKRGTLKIYPGFPHGMLTTHADVINRPKSADTVAKVFFG
jgi:hypothetical protein